MLISGFSYSQKMNSFERVEELRKSDSKPIVVLFTTEWCGVCQIQKKNLSKLPPSVWEKYHFISINPEKHKKDIVFLDKKYSYVSNGSSGLHQIVYDLAGGRVPAYPFWVFVDENQKIKIYEGLLKEKELSLIFLHNF